MSNPNNCESCQYKQMPHTGHCYMFRDEPTEVCMQHTGRIAPPAIPGELLFWMKEAK